MTETVGVTFDVDALRQKYAALADKRALDPILERAGCLAGLRG